ncbi:MAG: ATP-dependent RecD-like DNA helicase [Clostridiales bacterium]|nr:ATP-dependent RecD-like DNA helicase [Clostridiales bacterium]
METVTGFVEHITFRNTDNGYTVMDVESEGEKITCVGNIQTVTEGECVELTGEYTIHPTYGLQFSVRSCRVTLPEDAVSMEHYLASGAIKGVGPKLAAAIVRKFGDDTFRIIDEEPERLAEIKGISMGRAGEISAQMEEKKELRQAMVYLQNYGISLNLADRIYRTYGVDTYRILEENPYRLAEDVEGIGFKIADEIAGRIGIHADSDFRVRSGILYVLQQASHEGHTYLPSDVLTGRTCEMLGVEDTAVERQFTDMAVDKKLVIKAETGNAGGMSGAESDGGEDAQEDPGIRIYAPVYYYMEIRTAAMLMRLNVSFDDISPAAADHRIRQIESNTDIDLDELQREAVMASASNGLLVITGGPGTGKTTTINTIIRCFESMGMDILLAAPTGRAAKRMSETTGYEARTIHRLLGLSGADKGNNAGFEKNEDNPLETDVLIIDEMSMVDITLMHSLLKAVPVGTRLILVGDADQLPSVGPGRVLQDIIDSGCFKVVRLNHIFRQAAKSDIIVNAHRINRGEQVSLDNDSRDFFFLKRSEANAIINVCIQLIRDKLPRYVGGKPSDIQLLTPMRKGLLGVERLNKILQQYLNPMSPKKAERVHGDRIFREGDKVMQIKNNYQTEWEITSRYGIPVEKGLGVFNGDMGIIRKIDDFDAKMTVEFEEGRMVDYPFTALDELELAYAITIHKAQGSEYPAVVIPLRGGPRMLMNRNLLYTAVTRARKCVTLVGDPGTFYAMIENASQQKRYSGLCDRLAEL